MAEKESWVSVYGWRGFYEVSSLGRVRSVDRVIECGNRFGEIECRRLRGQLLKPGANPKSGYLMVSFTRPGGVRECRYVHELVATAFLGPRPPGMEVCHKNGKRPDCRSENLRWGTRSSNALDRHEHGTMNQARGEKHYFSKLTADDVRWLRENFGKMSVRAMARRLGVTHCTADNAIHGRTWKHVWMGVFA